MGDNFICKNKQEHFLIYGIWYFIVLQNRGMKFYLLKAHDSWYVLTFFTFDNDLKWNLKKTLTFKQLR